MKILSIVPLVAETQNYLKDTFKQGCFTVNVIATAEDQCLDIWENINTSEHKESRKI